MAKTPSKTTADASDTRTRASEAVRSAPGATKEQAQRDFADRIQAALKLSELVETGKAMKANSAHRKAAEQVRAGLQLPHLEAITKQARDAAAVEHGSALPSPSAEPSSNGASSVAIASAQDLGQLVREAREQRKLSQQAFADLVGVGRRFISELENGKATLEFGKVLQVASATGIDVLARRRR